MTASLGRLCMRSCVCASLLQLVARVPAAAQFLLDADSGAHKQAFAKRERLLLQAGAAAGDA